MKEDENLDARPSRRELLCAAGAGAFALLDRSPLWSGILAGQTRRIVQFNLNLTTGQSQVLPGALTNVWRFTSSVAKGAPGSIVPIPGSYLGPLIKLKKGDVVKVTVNNLIAEDSVVHWHGLHVPANVDGHPSQSVLPGASYSSMFPIVNRAGTYWYHPHPDMKTGGQVYNGLAGMIIVSDDEEKVLPLPRGNYDLPIVIQDRVCDTGNQWVYVPNSFVGTLGNKILVNGKYTYIENVATRIYRLRILNGSNARIYKLAWDDASPMIVIGTDGGLLAQPASKPYLTLGPGERAEVWANFTNLPVGSDRVLKSLSFTGAGSGGGSGLAQGAAFDVMRFHCDRTESESLTLPSNLTNLGFFNPANAVNAENPRTFAISIVNGKYVLNGEEFYMNQVASNEEVHLNDLEVWCFTNTASGTQVAHPLHLHGAQFQVIERSVEPAKLANWQTVSGGFTDEGWKDTFIIMPGETVKILVKFSRYTGVFLYHCHTLEHEDMGMMRNYRILP